MHPTLTQGTHTYPLDIVYLGWPSIWIESVSMCQYTCPCQFGRSPRLICVGSWAVMHGQTKACIHFASHKKSKAILERDGVSNWSKQAAYTARRNSCLEHRVFYLWRSNRPHFYKPKARDKTTWGNPPRPSRQPAWLKQDLSRPRIPCNTFLFSVFNHLRDHTR